MEAVSTSHVEWQNLMLRTSSRRFTRRTNTFAKKIDNQETQWCSTSCATTSRAATWSCAEKRRSWLRA
jgi:hypothetical protein